VTAGSARSNPLALGVNLANRNSYVSRGASNNYGLITAALGRPRTFGATLRVKL